MSDFVKTQLDRYGHRYCPENLVAGDVPNDEQWAAAPASETFVQAAVRSYQTWFSDRLDQLTERAVEFGGHRRASIADGEAGENTTLLLEHARCGVADYFHPEEMVIQGNWPPTCRNDITVSWNFDELPGLSEAQTDDMFLTSANNISGVINLNMVIVKHEYPNTRCAVVIASLPGSTLADQYLAVSDCGFTSQGRMDRRDWSQPGLGSAVRTHEDVHMCGGRHIPNQPGEMENTMNPYITQQVIARHGELSPGDIAEMVRVGYTVREEPPTQDWISGNHEVKDAGGNVIGRCHLVADSAYIDTQGMIWIDGQSIIKRPGVGRDRKFVLEAKETGQ